MEELFAWMLRGAVEVSFPPPERWSPRINIKKAWTEMIVTAELPGVDPTDVRIRVVGTLLLFGSPTEEAQKSEPPVRAAKTFLRECEKAIPLPLSADVPGIEARWTGHALKITVPLREEEPQHQRALCF